MFFFRAGEIEVRGGDFLGMVDGLEVIGGEVKINNML